MKPEPTRLGPAELSLFLRPTTLAEAMRAPGIRRRPKDWWTRAIASAECAGLVRSPGASTRWELTTRGQVHAIVTGGAEWPT